MWLLHTNIHSVSICLYTYIYTYCWHSTSQMRYPLCLTFLDYDYIVMCTYIYRSTEKNITPPFPWNMAYCSVFFGRCCHIFKAPEIPGPGQRSEGNGFNFEASKVIPTSCLDMYIVMLRNAGDAPGHKPVVVVLACVFVFTPLRGRVRPTRCHKRKCRCRSRSNILRQIHPKTLYLAQLLCL